MTDTTDLKCDRDGCESPCDYLLDTRLPICAPCYQELKAIIPADSAGTDLIARVNECLSVAKPVTFWLLVVDEKGNTHQFGRYDSIAERKDAAKEIARLFKSEAKIFALNVGSNGHPQFLTWNPDEIDWSLVRD